MENLSPEYDSIAIKLYNIFISGVSIGDINKEFENIAMDGNLNDMTAGSLFGYMLIWWTEEYEFAGDEKSLAIIKQSVITIQKYRTVIYPQIWQHLQITHLGLIKKLFPERF